ncbi:MAG TPA: hypothetical protein VMP12_12510 [Candidatus Sulfotelmatobacter sp.]|nr:hypothetical protein [Candidatus Sulfotelmatobacter sp.]
MELRDGNLVYRFLIKASLTALLSVACPAFIVAQAPPGPLTGAPSQDTPAPAARPQAPKPAIQPRTSIFGEWQLNRDDSDDPQKKMQEARSDRGNGGYGGSGPRVGFPGGGIGGGGLGGHRNGQQGESDEERQKMQELVNPGNKLTIAEATKNVEIDVLDDQQRKLALFTDGRKIQKSKDANNQEIAAHWDGKQLATDEKSPRGNKMSRTYELSYDGTQLYETLHMTTGRSNTPLLIRYVYDAYGPPPSASSAPKQ